MENTDFVIEHIDEEVQVIADQPSVVTNYPANTDFFIENIDSNVISIAHSLNIEASEVDFRPANTDFFVENIDKNLIEIAESLSLTPYEVTIRPVNTDMFIENIDKNVTLIKGSTNVVTVSGEYININLPDGGKVQSAQIDGNATQTGTPTPDAPIPVQTVTGENTVKVVGKNLMPFTTQDFTLNNVHYKVVDGNLTLDGTSTGETSNQNAKFKTNFNFWLEAGTYTLSYGGGTTGMSMRIRNYDDNTPISTDNINNTNLSDTFTLNARTHVYLGFYVYKASFSNKALNIQLELGSTATAYEPYQGQEFEVDLGSIELAKIGTYQDRIYKDGEKWYVEKQIGKVVLNGSEDGWGLSGNTANNQYFLNLAGFPEEYNPVNKVMSDFFSVAPQNTAYDYKTIVGIGGWINSGGQIRIAFDTSIVDRNLASFKSWLSTHPTTVYYALATPTTTEITNQSLIDQLEALASATLGYGVNNIFTEIATGNAMPTLKLVIEKY